MKTIDVNVKFEGTITIEVPDHLSDGQANDLAERLVLARVVATMDNPDAPEDAACEDGEEKDWDACVVTGVCGTWMAK
ncbi:MAG: hypothetical protein M0R80_23650 [Proteobacteria bacterium]|jgi:hypothetical protein|nr:hypothetical protein [Pseudomonadota bacterium]